MNHLLRRVCHRTCSGSSEGYPSRLFYRAGFCSPSRPLPPLPRPPKRIETVFDSVVAQRQPQDPLLRHLSQLRRSLVSAKDAQHVDLILSHNASFLLCPSFQRVTRLMDILRTSRRPNLAFQVFEWKNKQPNVVMEPHDYAKAIRLAGCLGQLETAESLYTQMVSKGVHRTIEVENAMMHAYAHGHDSGTEDVFEPSQGNTNADIKPKSSISSRGLASACKRRYLQYLEKSYNDLKEGGYQPSLETFNWLMLGYLQLGVWWRMEDVFSVMTASCKPDALTFRTLIRGYAAANMLDRMEAVQEEMLRQGYPLRSKTAEVMVAAYQKERDFYKMEKLLFSIKSKSFDNNMKKKTMRSHLCNDQISEIDALVEEALSKNELAFSSALADLVVRAYFKKREFEKIDKFLEASHAHGWNIKTSVYNTLIYLNGKFGFFNRMEHYFDRMLVVGCQPNARTFRIMSSACEAGGNIIEVGQRILVKMKDAGYDICKFEQLARDNNSC